MNTETDLSRFSDAHRLYYRTALMEIRNGRKVSHWMWYIFPQIHGLGSSALSQLFAVRSREEARAFLQHPCLGRNLREISQALLALDTDDPEAVFGRIDSRKLRSCMTLFQAVSDGEPVFGQVLERYFSGIPDKRTLEILSQEAEKEATE